MLRDMPRTKPNLTSPAGLPLHCPSDAARFCVCDCCRLCVFSQIRLDTPTYGRDGVAKRSNVRRLGSIFGRQILGSSLIVALCR
jgi:hypothetical protein